MRFRCNRKTLLATCESLKKVACPRSSNPILQNFLAVSDGKSSQIWLQATDTEIWLEILLDVEFVSGEHTTSGREVILPSERMISILKASDSEEVLLDCSDQKLKVITKRGRHSLETQSPDAFPKIPEFPSTAPNFHIRSSDFVEMIERTAFVALQTTYANGGLLFFLRDGLAHLAATDGKRFALATAKQDRRLPFDPECSGEIHNSDVRVILPRKALIALARMLAIADKNSPQEEGEKDTNFSDEQDVRGEPLAKSDSSFATVASCGNIVQFSAERSRLCTRIMDGNFPKYESFLNQKHQFQVLVSAKELMAALREAAVVADPDSSRILCKFLPGSLLLETDGANLGFSEISLVLPECQHSLDISLSVKYLNDLMKVIGKDEMILVHLKSADRPAFFTVGDHYTHMLMPMC